MHSCARNAPDTVSGNRPGWFLLALLICSGMTTPLALAADDAADEQNGPRLSVEFIVFERSNNAGHEEERWPARPGLPAIHEAVELDSDPARELRLERRSSDLQLNRAAERLGDSRDYRVLRHERWVFPERERQESPLIRLQLDERPAGEATTADDGEPRRRVFADEHLLDQPDQDRDEAAERIRVSQPLDGTLRVFRNRYFHVSADLIFNPVEDATPSPAEQARQRLHRLEALLAGQISFEEYQQEEESEPFPGYRLNESRRVRLGQLHYLDHPRFGVLLRIDREQD
ncbi:CsiV family protein [Natronospira bacteriovora]|uniref:CsiV family protein n=1 Tax=Natronospira bacteriovora TaxID=3069753 RepID=A0ABU0W2P0_9GAMM|nr:CsiV family protein [Natronospira sp. AB-CW4]MDQ2068270.1 CsiV family protein [Natronospira sp. AB-CW4]